MRARLFHMTRLTIHDLISISLIVLGRMGIIFLFCECKDFRVVHIFAFFAFLKYLRKYIQLENYLYYAT